MQGQGKSTVADIQARRRPAVRVIAFILYFAALVILLMLGSWQVQRLHWKEALIAQRAAKMATAPMKIGDIMNVMTATMPPDEPPFEVEFQPVTATGTFDHAHELYFLATLDGEPGFNVYTPFRLAAGSIVLVNRGFVPEQFKDPASRKSGLVEGEVTIKGLAREALYAKPGFLVPDNNPAQNIFFWKDIRAMAAMAGIDRQKLVPFFIDAGSNADAAIWPKGGITIIDLPNNHLQYALTWYGLAVALLGVGLVSVYRRRRTPEA